MRRISSISINMFTAIPLFRYIVKVFEENFDEIIVLESLIIGLNNYYDSDIKIKHKSIFIFKDVHSFNTQSHIKKFYKYFRVSGEIIIRLLDSNTKGFYIIDFQVLDLLLVCMKFLGIRKKVIYHQFELVNIDDLKGLNLMFFKRVINNCKSIDLAIFPEENRRNYFIELSKFPPEKTHLFLNTCEIAKGMHATKHKIFNDLPSDKLIVGHIGNVGFQHYLNELLLLINNPELPEYIHFLFVGIIDEKIIEIFNHNRNRISFSPALPHNELNQVYPFLNYGLILYKGVDLNFEYCAPNKLFEYWANGIPVFAHDLKGLHKLFTHPSLGTLTDMNNPVKFYKDFTGFISENRNKQNELLYCFLSSYEINKAVQSFKEQLSHRRILSV